MTWGDFLASIPFRLNRDDLPAEFVEGMAKEQITLYGPQLFTPSEIIDYSITTSPGVFNYPLPAGFQALNFVRVLQGGIWIPVAPAQSINDILLVDAVQPNFQSLPVSLYRVYGKQIRLFPCPFGALPVELTMMGTVPGPTSPDDSTNFWVNDGNVFLRAATCLAICMEYTDAAMPTSPRILYWEARRDQALSMLQTQVHMTTQPSTIRGYL